MVYIAQHSSPLRGTSLDGKLQSAVAKYYLLGVTHVDLLIFWEDLIEVAHEFHMLTSGLREKSVRKKGDNTILSPQSARVRICSYSYTSIQYPVVDQLRTVSLNSKTPDNFCRRNIPKTMVAYSSQPPSTTRNIPSFILRGPDSSISPSKDEHPGPPCDVISTISERVNPEAL